MKQKSISKQKKRLENQLSKTQDQISSKYSKTLKREIPTLRGKIINKINSLKNQEK